MDDLLKLYASVRESKSLVPSSETGFPPELHEKANELVRRKDKPKYDILPIYDIIIQSLGKDKHIENIMNGLYNLSKYPLCLFLDQDRPEFHQIRTFSGFYIYEIKELLDGFEPVLEAIGYKLEGQLYRLDMDKKNDPGFADKLGIISCELLLAYEELKVFNDLRKLAPNMNPIAHFTSIKQGRPPSQHSGPQIPYNLNLNMPNQIPDAFPNTDVNNPNVHPNSGAPQEAARQPPVSPFKDPNAQFFQQGNPPPHVTSQSNQHSTYSPNDPSNISRPEYNNPHNPNYPDQYTPQNQTAPNRPPKPVYDQNAPVIPPRPLQNSQNPPFNQNNANFPAKQGYSDRDASFHDPNPPNIPDRQISQHNPHPNYGNPNAGYYSQNPVRDAEHNSQFSGRDAGGFPQNTGHDGGSYSQFPGRDAGNFPQIPGRDAEHNPQFSGRGTGGFPQNTGRDAGSISQNPDRNMSEYQYNPSQNPQQFADPQAPGHIDGRPGNFGNRDGFQTQNLDTKHPNILHSNSRDANDYPPTTRPYESSDIRDGTAEMFPAHSMGEGGSYDPVGNTPLSHTPGEISTRNPDDQLPAPPIPKPMGMGGSKIPTPVNFNASEHEIMSAEMQAHIPQGKLGIHSTTPRNPMQGVGGQSHVNPGSGLGPVSENTRDASTFEIPKPQQFPPTLGETNKAHSIPAPTQLGDAHVDKTTAFKRDATRGLYEHSAETQSPPPAPHTQQQSHSGKKENVYSNVSEVREEENATQGPSYTEQRQPGMDRQDPTRRPPPEQGGPDSYGHGDHHSGPIPPQMGQHSGHMSPKMGQHSGHMPPQMGHHAGPMPPQMSHHSAPMQPPIGQHPPHGGGGMDPYNNQRQSQFDQGSQGYPNHPVPQQTRPNDTPDHPANQYNPPNPQTMNPQQQMGNPPYQRPGNPQYPQTGNNYHSYMSNPTVPGQSNASMQQQFQNIHMQNQSYPEYPPEPNRMGPPPNQARFTQGSPAYQATGQMSHPTPPPRYPMDPYNQDELSQMREAPYQATGQQPPRRTFHPGEDPHDEMMRRGYQTGVSRDFSQPVGPNSREEYRSFQNPPEPYDRQYDDERYLQEERYSQQPQKYPHTPDHVDMHHQPYHPREPMPPRTPWVCKHCTFENKADAKICEMCSKSRDFNLDTPTTHMKECEICHKLNPIGERNCLSCQRQIFD